MLSTINDNETLALIANHSSDEQLRRSAIAKINDPATLKELAKFSRKQEIRNIAIDKISHLSDDESAEIISKIAKEKRSGIKQRAKKKKIVIQQNHVRVTKEEFAQKQQEVADEPEVVEKPPKVSGLNEIIRAFRDLIGI
jgi:Glu-tRNA(Gln) amidotransferase subunit E-like FAD-binding protein